MPKIAIPDDLQEEVDEIRNRCAHLEKKVDGLRAQATLIYADTQVIRALTPKP